MTANRPKVPPSEEVTTHSNVVHAEERFLAPRPAVSMVGIARVTKLHFGLGYRTAEPEPQRGIVPFLQNLPFVKIKGSGRRARVASYWIDTPTGNGRADFRRGRGFAARVIVAMNADPESACYLERIIEAIVIDAASRRGRGGKYSRTLPPASQGFIYELSRQLACPT